MVYIVRPCQTKETKISIKQNSSSTLFSKAGGFSGWVFLLNHQELIPSCGPVLISNLKVFGYLHNSHAMVAQWTQFLVVGSIACTIY